VPLVLDLLRHGAALPAVDGGDEARALSPRGLADLERLASRLAQLGWRPDRAFASPLRRARDSATIALRRAAPHVTVERMDALCPDAAAADVVAALAAAGADSGHVLLVAHQPLLGRLAAHLGGGGDPGFAPGALVRVEFKGALAPGRGVAGWRLGPGGVGA
jgi:phosphohistidine phosphatase SixA